MKQNKKQKYLSFAKYLPVLVIMLSLTIIASSTFAFFTNRLTPQGNPTVNFGKVEISDGNSFEISTPLMDALPGDTIISSPIQFSVANGSRPVYVRAKISYSTENTTPEMLYFVNRLREATAYSVVNGTNYKWGTKSGNYIYLEQSGDNIKDLHQAAYNSANNPTYTLVNSFKIPTEVKNLNGNDQYMKSVTVHIAIQAIQAENLGNRDTDAIKALFNDLFPESEAEKINTVTVTVYGNTTETVDVYYGDRLSDYTLPTYTPAEGYSFVGWTSIENGTTPVDQSALVTTDMDLYPILEELPSSTTYTITATKAQLDTAIASFMNGKSFDGDPQEVETDIYSRTCTFSGITITGNAYGDDTTDNFVIEETGSMTGNEFTHENYYAKIGFPPFYDGQDGLSNYEITLEQDDASNNFIAFLTALETAGATITPSLS